MQRVGSFAVAFGTPTLTFRDGNNKTKLANVYFPLTFRAAPAVLVSKVDAENSVRSMSLIPKVNAVSAASATLGYNSPTQDISASFSMRMSVVALGLA